MDALGSSDKKFSQVDDRDLTDSEGGNDSDFEPKVTESKNKTKPDAPPKVFLESNKDNEFVRDDKFKANSANRIRRDSNVNRSQSRSPPICTAPKRKAQRGGYNYSKSTGSVNSKVNMIQSTSRLLFLQQELNKMLQEFTEPIPTSLRRIGTTFISNDKTYQAPVGVLLNFLMRAATLEIPARTKPVSYTYFIMNTLDPCLYKRVPGQTV